VEASITAAVKSTATVTGTDSIGGAQLSSQQLIFTSNTRRSGTCFCNMGYQGIDCGQCTTTHFQVLNLSVGVHGN
jgi:hypothetical protein